MLEKEIKKEKSNQSIELDTDEKMHEYQEREEEMFITQAEFYEDCFYV